MNREGAETYLRLLAEAAMRGPLAPAPGSPWAAGASGRTTMMVVGRALTAVGALDMVTVEEILADFNLAVSVRQLRDQTSQGPGAIAAAARWAVQSQSVRSGPHAWAGRLARTRPSRGAPAHKHRRMPKAPPGLSRPGMTLTRATPTGSSRSG